MTRQGMNCAQRHDVKVDSECMRIPKNAVHAGRQDLNSHTGGKKIFHRFHVHTHTLAKSRLYRIHICYTLHWSIHLHK